MKFRFTSMSGDCFFINRDFARACKTSGLEHLFNKPAYKRKLYQRAAGLGRHSPPPQPTLPHHPLLGQGQQGADIGVD